MSTPKKLRKVAEKTDTRLTDLIEAEKVHLQEAIKQLEKDMIDLVKELETTEKGLLVGPKVNLKQAQKIHMKLGKLFDEKYGDAARETVNGFNKVAEWIIANYVELGIAAEFTSIDKDVLKVLKAQSLKQFERFGVEAQDKAAQAMYNAVASGGKFSDLVGSLEGIMLGGKDARGASMSQYADLWANDAIMNFHNALNLKKADDAGIEHFLYFGNLINTSRDFCIHRVGKVYSRKEIDSWNSQKWNGKSGPAFTNRGGWNCRHHWQPVPIPVKDQLDETDGEEFQDVESDRVKVKEEKKQQRTERRKK